MNLEKSFVRERDFEGIVNDHFSHLERGLHWSFFILFNLIGIKLTIFNFIIIINNILHNCNWMQFSIAFCTSIYALDHYVLQLLKSCLSCATVHAVGISCSFVYSGTIFHRQYMLSEKDNSRNTPD